MVKTFVLIMLMGASHTFVNAQVFSELKGFLRMKSKPVWLRKTPAMTVSHDNVSSYWQGSSFTNFSENGRIKSTMSFDIHGQIRESFSSINLKKSGVLSYWRIQFSSRRTHPVIVYTIH